MQQTLGPRSIPAYHRSMVPETQLFIHALVSDSRDYIRHIRRYAGGLALSIVYGHKVSASDDEYLLLAEKCMDLLSNKIAPSPGIWLVDVLPALRFLPSWFPGASFKRKAVEWKAQVMEFVDRPFETAHA